MAKVPFGSSLRTRRQFLSLLGASGYAVLLAACSGAAQPAPSTAGPVPSNGGSVAASAKPSPAGASAPASGSAPATSDWAQIVEAARREGEVNVYAGAGQPNREAMGDPFEKAYPGIKVNLTIAPPGDLLARLQAERGANKFLADVLPGFGASAIIPLKPVNALVPLQPLLQLPEVVDAANWLDNRLWWLDSAEPYTTLAFVGNVQSPVLYNTTMVDPSQFKSYRDLLDPKWKGKMASNDIRRPGTGAVPARFMYRNQDLGPDFLGQLFGDTNLTLSTDLRQLIDWLAQGRFPLGLFMLSGDVTAAINQGLPIGVVPAEQFKEGSPIGPAGGTISVVDRGPHPNAAKVFANWLLSKDGQTNWQKTINDNSLRTDVPKDGVPKFYVSKSGVKYVNAATEDYAKLSGTVISDVINKALEKQPK